MGLLDELEQEAERRRTEEAKVAADSAAREALWRDKLEPAMESLADPGEELGAAGEPEVEPLFAQSPAEGLGAASEPEIESEPEPETVLLSEEADEEKDLVDSPRETRVLRFELRVRMEELPPALRDALASLDPADLRLPVELRLATDIPDYARHALEAVAASPGFAVVSVADTPWPGWLGTRYEAKALAAGRRPQYLTFRRAR